MWHQEVGEGGETEKCLASTWSRAFLPNRVVILLCVGSLTFHLSRPFHLENDCFTDVPLNFCEKKNVCWQVWLASIQCYHADTVLSNIWRKSFCSILYCLLGCEAAVGRLATWWAALRFTLRIKLFIHDGDIYRAWLRLWRRFCLLQLTFTGWLLSLCTYNFIFTSQKYTFCTSPTCFSTTFSLNSFSYYDHETIVLQMKCIFKSIGCLAYSQQIVPDLKMIHQEASTLIEYSFNAKWNSQLLKMSYLDI